MVTKLIHATQYKYAWPLLPWMILMYSLAADILENAYLTAPCREEEVWLRGGAEFGHRQGKVLVVRKALYGLKSSSGAAFCVFLAEKLEVIGFRSSIADPDVCMHPVHQEQHDWRKVLWVHSMLRRWHSLHFSLNDLWKRSNQHWSSRRKK